MFTADTVAQTDLLIVLCFSFFSFLLSLYMKREEFLARILGMSFFAPLCLSTFAFFSNKATAFRSSLFIGEILLLIIFSLLLTVTIKRRYLKLIEFMIILVPVVVLFIFLYINQLSSYLNTPETVILLYTFLSILSIISIIKQKKEKKWLILGIFLLPIGNAIFILSRLQILSYFALFIKLFAYLSFSTYFAYKYIGELKSKVTRVEEKLASMTKSFNHEVKKRVIEIERINEKLVKMSKTDPLSSLLNKTALLDKIEKLIYSNNKEGFSIIMFDIDDFKSINDIHGHITGDKCIRKLALIIRESIRDIDIAGRYGGDEFVVIVPGTDATQCRYIGERLRKNVEKTNSPHFTISAGIASYPYDARDINELIKAADEALYLSKEKGKNTTSHRSLF
jgi:diguanylate cyclase (GGDEF)-like protein